MAAVLEFHIARLRQLSMHPIRRRRVRDDIIIAVHDQHRLADIADVTTQIAVLQNSQAFFQRCGIRLGALQKTFA